MTLLGSSNCRDRVPTAWVTRQTSLLLATENVLPSLHNPNFRKVPLNPGQAALQQVHTAQRLLWERSRSRSHSGLDCSGPWLLSVLYLVQHLGSGGLLCLLFFRVLVSFLYWPISLVQ